MNTFMKYATAVAVTGAMAFAMATPGQARDGHNAAAAAIGFGAGAIVGAAAASSANAGYYDRGYAYDSGYAYEPSYAYEAAPVYVEPYDSYAYEAPRYRARSWQQHRTNDFSIDSQR